MAERNASYSLTGGQADKISEAKSGKRRKVMSITNLNAAGGANVYIAVGAEAVNSSGIQLLPGQAVTWSENDGYKLPQSAVFAFAAAAGSTLGIYEEIED